MIAVSNLCENIVLSVNVELLKNKQNIYLHSCFKIIVIIFQKQIFATFSILVISIIILERLLFCFVCVAQFSMTAKEGVTCPYVTPPEIIGSSSERVLSCVHFQRQNRINFAIIIIPCIRYRVELFYGDTSAHDA